jgi:hemin uptake protein HemP
MFAQAALSGVVMVDINDASRSKPDRFTPSGESVPNAARFKSEALFGGGKVIVIQHAGREYRLRITRANKLILTA